MSILNSLPAKIGMATETSNGLMSFEDKKLVNKINRMESDISNKMNKNEKIKSSQLDISKDSFKIQESNLSSTILNKLNGIPVAPEGEIKIPIFTKESITTDLYADNSVTAEKRTAVGSVAVIASDEPCNFIITDNETEDVELILPRNYNIYYGNHMETIVDTPEILRIPKGVSSVITYSIINGFTTYPDTAILEDDYLVGVFDGERVTLFFGRYTVNGSSVIEEQSLDGSVIKDFSLDSRKLAIQHGIILSEKSFGPYLNINFNSNLVEVIETFDISISDQYTMDIKNNHSCSIPENINDNKYLYIYYDLGLDKLNAKWSSLNIERSIITYDNEKLVLIGVINTIDYKAVGINSEFISVNETSRYNKSVEYADLFTGDITIDFSTKKIHCNNVTAFMDDSLIKLTKGDIQTIDINEDIVTDITSSGIPYTLAAIKDFHNGTYSIVLDKTENIKNIGLKTIYITTVKKYNVSNNSKNITLIKPDGNVVKITNTIPTGYVLPMDDKTIIAEMSTELLDGILTLRTTVLSGSSIINPVSNIVYDIKDNLTSDIVIKNLRGIYSVLFNTENAKIEVLPIGEKINPDVYISLGFVSNLNDSLMYTATGPITEHITLNSYRPSNYAVISGPDPDKGYDWSNNRLVLPKDIYLMANSQYSFYCQNMSMNKYIDNDYILYEIGLPHSSVISENVLNINSPLKGDFETRVVGKFKGNNNCLYKDINIHFETPVGKELSILCIGDDTVDMNMPAYIQEYLIQLGYIPTMLGKVKNVINSNGYGMKNLTDAYGEGHKGWRFTDFMGSTKLTSGASYIIENNPFINNKEFDFSYYMDSNSYYDVDVVVISAGMNDITGYHVSSAFEDIEKLNIYENMEQLPNMYKQMISSIHRFNPDIKIIINPTMIKGINDEFNKKSLMLAEVLMYELKDMPNVFFAPGYLTQPLFASANKDSVKDYDQYNEINDTKIGSAVESTEINGIAQSNLAYMITSAIVALTK